MGVGASIGVVQGVSRGVVPLEEAGERTTGLAVAIGARPAASFGAPESGSGLWGGDGLRRPHVIRRLVCRGAPWRTATCSDVLGDAPSGARWPRDAAAAAVERIGLRGIASRGSSPARHRATSTQPPAGV